MLDGGLRGRSFLRLGIMVLVSRFKWEFGRCIQGHPQCLRNITIVDLPSPIGSRRLLEVGARVPSIGVAATSTGGGGGVCHDINDFGSVRFANGFAKGESCAFESFDPDFDS